MTFITCGSSPIQRHAEWITGNIMQIFEKDTQSRYGASYFEAEPLINDVLCLTLFEQKKANIYLLSQAILS